MTATTTTAETVERADAAPARRRLGRRDLGGIIALVLLLAAMVAAFTASLWLTRVPEAQSLTSRLLPPAGFGDSDPAYPLGTDALGRDIFARLVHGGQISFVVGLVAASLAGIVGTALGVIAGYRQGWLESAILRIVDVQTAFPFLIVAISIVAVVGASLRTIVIALVLWVWVPFARLGHARTLGVKQTDYFRAAVAIGRSDGGIILRHVIPNIVPPLIVVWTFVVAQTIVVESTMSFLGLGVPPPRPTWGGMLSDGRGYLDTAWWIAVVPGAAIFLTVLAVNVLGDWLSARLDPYAEV